MCKYKSVDAVLYAVFEYRRVSFFPPQASRIQPVSTKLFTVRDAWLFYIFLFFDQPRGSIFVCHCLFVQALVLNNWHWFLLFTIKSRRREGLHVSFSNRNSARLTHTELLNMTFVMFPCYAHNRPRLVRARGGHWDAVCPCSVRQRPRLKLNLSMLSNPSPTLLPDFLSFLLCQRRQCVWQPSLHPDHVPDWHTHCFCFNSRCVFIWIDLLWSLNAQVNLNSVNDDNAYFLFL